MSGKIHIAESRAWLLDMPLKQPYSVAYESYDSAKNIVVRLETESGAEGWGCAAPDRRGGRKQDRHEDPLLVEGIPVDEFVRNNADPIWLHQHEMWELMEEDVSDLPVDPDTELF